MHFTQYENFQGSKNRDLWVSSDSRRKFCPRATLEGGVTLGGEGSFGFENQLWGGPPLLSNGEYQNLQDTEAKDFARQIVDGVRQIDVPCGLYIKTPN